MSVASILQALAENAGQAQLRKGAIYGGLISDAAQIPSQILADKERQRAVALNEQRLKQQMDLERSRASREDQLAQHGQAQDAKVAQTEQHLGAIIGAGFANDPATFDQGAAVSKAQEIGRPDLIPTVAAVHDKFTKKPDILKKDEVGFDPITHEPIPGMNNPGAPKTREITVANPDGTTTTRIVPDIAGSDFPSAPKPITYGQPVSALVNGKRQFVRTGSDGKTYDLSGKEVQGSSVTPEGEKTPANSYQLQPELDATGKQTGRFLGYNTKTNAWEPVRGEGPASTKAAPGAAAAVVEAKTKTETLNTLNLLDSAIDAVKDKVGPGAGRASTVQQMIGNADPKVQDLAVKLKTAKMQYDHAITGSVRGGASPTLLKQWDSILDNKVTPEGLKAAVQSMRELLGGSAPGSGIKSITEIK